MPSGAVRFRAVDPVHRRDPDAARGVLVDVANRKRPTRPAAGPSTSDVRPSRQTSPFEVATHRRPGRSRRIASTAARWAAPGRGTAPGAVPSTRYRPRSAPAYTAPSASTMTARMASLAGPSSDRNVEKRPASAAGSAPVGSHPHGAVAPHRDRTRVVVARGRRAALIVRTGRGRSGPVRRRRRSARGRRPGLRRWSRPHLRGVRQAFRASQVEKDSPSNRPDAVARPDPQVAVARLLQDGHAVLRQSRRPGATSRRSPTSALAGHDDRRGAGRGKRRPTQREQDKDRRANGEEIAWALAGSVV